MQSNTCVYVCAPVVRIRAHTLLTPFAFISDRLIYQLLYNGANNGDLWKTMTRWEKDRESCLFCIVNHIETFKIIDNVVAVATFSLSSFIFFVIFNSHQQQKTTNTMDYYYCYWIPEKLFTVLCNAILRRSRSVDCDFIKQWDGILCKV